MKKYILTLLFALVSITIFSANNCNDANGSVVNKSLSQIKYDVIDYTVSHQYINREGWGNYYTIRITNNCDEVISVRFTAKGCNGETDSVTIRAYATETITIATGDNAVSGWAISILRL